MVTVDQMQFSFMPERGTKLCDELEAVQEFAYLGDRVSASGGCSLVWLCDKERERPCFEKGIRF